MSILSTYEELLTGYDVNLNLTLMPHILPILVNETIDDEIRDSYPIFYNALAW